MKIKSITFNIKDLPMDILHELQENKKLKSPWYKNGVPNSVRRKISLANKGKIVSRISRARMRKAAVLSYINGRRIVVPSRGKIGFRKDIGHFVRSRWEANYARYLNYKGIKYIYEPKSFWLTNLRCSYTPDFLLSDGTYVEVKGYDSPLAKAKRKAFRKQYGKRLYVVGKKRYKRILLGFPSIKFE